MAYEYTRSEEALLTLDHVSLSFGDHLVLRDVCAKVTKIDRKDQPNGEVICFLGPSGMGKTQLSRIIAGLQVPSGGEVRLKDGPTAPGKVCMVPQSYPMFEYATVAENLRIAGKQGGLTKDQINARATEYIHLFDIGEHIAKYPRELSGGTKQRVAIARQLMCVSNYMVMDEPFSGLDPISKGKAMEAINNLAHRDAYNCIIIVTHDVTSGLTVADTVWMLGYERDTNGAPILGARLVDTFDLAALGFAWRPDLESDPKFLAFARQVKDRFKTLK